MMSWRTLFGLILCNAIWSTNPVVGKILMQDLPPLQVSWLRYFAALIASSIISIWLFFKKPSELSPKKNVLQNFGWLVWAGIITFFCSAYVQYVGLAESTPIVNSIIVAMEPLFAVFLAWLFLREKIHGGQYIGFIIAIIGFALLSHLKPHDLKASLSLFNTGNIYLLLSMPSEAMYSIVSRKVSGKITPMSLFAISLPIGFGIFTTYLLLSGIGIPDLSLLSLKMWGLVIWIGVIGTTISYAFWSFALIDAPVAAVSLTLFVQPITGSIWGTVIFGDRLDFWQCMGGLFILLALFIQTKIEMRKSV